MTTNQLTKLKEKAKWNGWDRCDSAEIILSLIREIERLQQELAHLGEADVALGEKTNIGDIK